MSDSASIQIILNASGNLGQVVDAASGKVLAMGRAAKGAGNAVAAESRLAAGSVAALGEQASRVFGGAGSAVAKFAGPLGAMGGIAAVAGFAITKALDAVIAKFREASEEPARLIEAIQKAAETADALAKSRDAAILGNVSKVGSTVEPLAAIGPGAVALARQISTDTGVPLDDVSKAVQTGIQANMDENAIRRMIQGAQLAARTGRMGFDDAVKAGVANRVDPGLSVHEVSADMINREAFQAHQKTSTADRRQQLLAHQRAQDQARAEHDRQQQEAYDIAQRDWNLGGQNGPMPTRGAEITPAPFRSTNRFKPAVTAADMADMESNLASNVIAQAVQAKRQSEAVAQDKSLGEVESKGNQVVLQAAAGDKLDRTHPGLRKFMEEDKKLQRAVEAAEYRASRQGWFGRNFGTNEVANIRKAAEARRRHTDAFIQTNPDGYYGRNEGDGIESVDSFNARISGEKDRLEQARQAQGLPFGNGILNVRIVNPDDIRAEPLAPAQVGE